MVASDNNKDIVHPMLRPDLNKDDMKKYIDIANTLGVDPTLEDNMSYMQFMNYNQICHLELLPMPPTLLYDQQNRRVLIVIGGFMRGTLEARLASTMDTRDDYNISRYYIKIDPTTATSKRMIFF